MPRTRLAACALAGVLVEDVVQRAGRIRQRVAEALAGVLVKVSVRATVLSLVPVPANALTAFHVQLLIGAAHIC